MKKIVIFILVVALVVSVGLLAVGCQSKDANGLIILKTPKNLVVNGDAISWGAVKNAEKYYVSVDGAEHESKTTTFVVPVIEKGVYKLRVKASGDGVKYGESEYSKEIDYVQNERLASPTPTISGNVMSWPVVEGAEKYSFTVANRDGKPVGVEITTAETSYVFEGENFAKPNIYTISLIAIPSADSREYIRSLASKVDYIVSVKLVTPDFVTFADSSTKMKWNSVEYASKYKLKITEISTGKSFETSETLYNNFNFADLDLKEPGDYTVQVKAVGDGKVFFDSDYSVVKPEYTLTKLKQIDKANIQIEYNEQTDEYVLKWKMSVEDFPVYTHTQIYFKAPNAEGKEVLGAVSVKIKKDKLEAEKEGATVEEENVGGEIVSYTYSYPLDRAFITKVEGTWEYKKDDSYYGKFFDVSLQVENSDISNRYVSAENVKVDNRYLSYQRPNVLNDGNGFAEIRKVGEFAYMTQHINDGNGGFHILSNLDFDNYEIPTIKEFKGVLEGGEYILKNAVMDAKLQKNMFFGFIEKNSGEVRNLNFANVKIKAQNSRYVGMVGQNNGIIKNCLVDGIVEGANGIVGGIAGKNTSTIDSCQTNASISGLIVGGICGVNISEERIVDGQKFMSRAQVGGSHANGKVEAKEVVVKDDDDKELADVDKIGIDKFLQDYDVEMLAGGLIGYNKGFVFIPIEEQGYPACSDGTTITLCKHGFSVPHPASVKYKSQIGTAPSNDYKPQVGHPACLEGDTCTHGLTAPPAQSDDYQAQVGTAPSSDYKPAVGKLGDVDYVAAQAVAGILDASVYYSSSTSNVTATMGDKASITKYIVSSGGLIGYNETDVNNSYAGKMYSYDIKTDNTVSASGTDAVAGGFAGVNNGKIVNSYASSSAIAGGKSGGFVAKNGISGVIKNCFSTRRSISNDKSHKGFVADDSGSIENCCFYSQFEIQGEIEGKVKKVTGDDFEDQILKIVNGDGEFGKMGSVKDVLKGGVSTKIQRGVYLCDIIYLETYKVTTRQNEGLSVYGYVVSRTFDDQGKPQYKTVECINNSNLDKPGDFVLKYSGSEVICHNEIKVIVTVR